MSRPPAGGRRHVAPAKRRITPRALLELKHICDPRIHPDGRHIAFVVTEADFEDSRWVSHLWLTEWRSPHVPDDTLPEQDAAPVDDQEEQDTTRQLTFSHDGESRPAWSPDGRFLAFISARPDDTERPPENIDDDEEPKEQLWLLPVEPGEPRKLTSAPEGVLDYIWAPDSRSIIILAPEPRPRAVESIRKDERSRRKVDPTVEMEDRLRRQVWRVDIDSRKRKLLFTGDYGIAEIALSQDGKRLCYTTNYTGLWNDYSQLDLWVRDLVTGQAWKPVERAGAKYRPRWSPDGKRVAFISCREPDISFSTETLFVVDVSDEQSRSAARAATPTAFDADVAEFEWCSSGGAICAVIARGAGTELCRIDSSRRLKTLALGYAAERRSMAVSAGGESIVWVQDSPRAADELMLRAESGEVVPLTLLNAEFANTYAAPRQEVVRWASADGTPVEGVLTYPMDHEPGTPCPLVLQIHGGPHGRSTNTLQSYNMPAVWSAAGYAVLSPNYRGSAGYGNAFATANRRDLGGGDFQDCMAGVDFLVEMGIADPGRLGVMGGSYGGYMTNWIVGHTDRFQAAVSQFGIFHLQTDYSNSDLSRWDHDYLGAYYWEDPDIYRQLSPGTYVERMRTPMLIIHGDDDNNTFISNSKELYQALRHRGVTSEFVHYPREGHGLHEPNHRLDEMRRCLAWMDRYVLRGGEQPCVYRVGDRVPSADEAFELRVARAEVIDVLGQPGDGAGRHSATSVVEVLLTLYRAAEAPDPPPLTFLLDDVTLVPHASSRSPRRPLRAVGVPLDAPGGKVIVEGSRQRVTFHPDPETGAIAFACAVAFRVPRAAGQYLLRVGEFAPVAVTWPAPDESDDHAKS